MTSWLRRPFQAPHPAVRLHRDQNVQALRAWAALLVVVDHGLQYFDSRFGFLGAGRVGVVLFFMISGYVIGLVSQEPWSPMAQTTYWKNRFIRLAPLYLVAVTFAALILRWLGWNFGLVAVVGNFLCLQNHDGYFGVSIPPLVTNRPLWTLNYELVYYALFVLVWKYRLSLGVVLGLCGFVALSTLFTPPHLGTMGAYASGFVFWLAGLLLAWLFPASSSVAPSTRFPFAGLLLILLATHYAVAGKVLLAATGLSVSGLPFFSATDFVFLPACFLLVGSATGRLNGITPLARIACCLPVVLSLAGAAVTGHNLLDERWGGAACCTLLGLPLLWTKLGSATLPRLSWLGGISYALYLFHEPLMIIATQLLPSTPRFATLAAFALSIPLAWALESKLQPLIRASLKPTG